MQFLFTFVVVNDKMPFMVNRMSLRKYAHVIITVKRHLMHELPVPEISVISQFLKKTDTCFDIGAHGGSWSKPLAGIVKNGQVYSFEALPYYADILSVTFRLLGCRNIQVFNKAVGDSEEKVTLVWRDGNGNRLTGKTHIRGEAEASEHLLEVEGIRLDTFMQSTGKRNVGFIKIDVEGAEMKVLKGSDHLIDRHRPVVFCELDQRWTSRYQYSPEDVFEHFSGKGYNSFIIESNLSVKPVTQTTYRNKGDVLFVPRERELPVNLTVDYENSPLQ